MLRWNARVIVDGTPDIRRLHAATLADAIAAFKAAMRPGEILSQVKGGHRDGECIMPISSEILDWTKE